jgi:transcriptional regulator with XRE-family HTH domain
MVDFAVLLPDEICATLGSRARARRILLNLSVDELAARIGVSNKTLGNFERTGRCTLATFTRILEALNATADLQLVLQTQTHSIEAMRAKAAVAPRQRAYRKSRGVAQ